LLLLERELDIDICPSYGASRPGDQPVFICDITKAKEMLKWQPTINVQQGVRGLIQWVRANKDLFLE
jgi:CDP-paratose 2-epimerase